MQEEAAHQKSKYRNLNKTFTKRKTSKEETVVIADSLDGDSSSRSESNNSSNETGKNSIAYDSYYYDKDSSSIFTLVARIAFDSMVADINLS